MQTSETIEACEKLDNVGMREEVATSDQSPL